MKIKVTDEIHQESHDRIIKLLIEYNLSKTEEFRNEINKPIEIIARDERNEIIGGLYGRSIWGTLEVKTFVVKPENRNQGIG
nr:GNAT family N-acetyltransferase [uncultured Flavobacterium sp.]